jgi:thiol:disulfide interchange protein DsbD
MRRLLHILIFSTLLLAGFTVQAQTGVTTGATDTDPLLAEASLSPHEWAPGMGGSLQIKMTLPPEFHAYEEQFKITILEPDGFKMSTPLIEPTIEWFDKFSKRQRRGMQGEAVLKVHIEAPDRFLKRHDKMILELRYQACSDQFCLFPTTKKIEVPLRLTLVEGESALQEAKGNETIAPAASFFSSEYLTQYISESLLFAIFVAFLAGILTSFTPCIFPMIPITLAVLGNHSNERTRMQNFITSCVYVLGIATTYSILGLVAASSGSLFGATLGNPYVLSVVCVIFLAMALSMYGLYELQVPAFIRNRFGKGGAKKTGLTNAFVTGLFAGIVASPCVGPVLVAILTHVASTQNLTRGFFLLFSYALGLGWIFIALGLSSNLIKSLPRSGPWMNAMKFVLGTLMLGAFYYYLELLLPARWFDGALGLGLVILASIYGAFGPKKGPSNLRHIQKGLMQAALLVGFGYIIIFAFDLRPYIQGRIMAGNSLNQIQKLNWQPYSEAALAQATKDRKPVIIDFWAEWCAACHELEERTFSDPRVRAMANNYVLLKYDATSDSAELKELKRKYGIQGLPTVLFFNPHGLWIDALTLTQFENANGFIKRMEKAAN